jgi:hypothetical protein
MRWISPFDRAARMIDPKNRVALMNVRIEPSLVTSRPLEHRISAGTLSSSVQTMADYEPMNVGHPSIAGCDELY